MSFQNLVQSAQQYFPNLKIKYKNQSWFMKIIGTILFFNKSFMTDYATTIGSTVYFPNEAFTRTRPISAAVVLLHELVHVADAKKISKPLFFFLYLFPQILAPLSLLLLLISWKLAIPMFILFALPLPSYFRMNFEKKAYLASLYSLSKLGTMLKFNPLLATQEQGFVDNFKDSSYYFMWPFSNIKKDFDAGVELIKAGKRPFEDPVFDIIDNLADKV